MSELSMQHQQASAELRRGRRTRLQWSTQEVAKLRALHAHPDMRFIDIAKRLNRSTKSVALKSWKIGLRKRLTVNSTSSKRLFEIVWSERNKRVLRQTYLEYEAKAIGERLNRSAKAVYTMAKKLGLRKRRPIHVWKPSEYAFLAELSTLEAALKIRCSRQAVANKRREMRGLKRATKSYREYLLQTKKNGASERRCNG